MIAEVSSSPGNNRIGIDDTVGDDTSWEEDMNIEIVLNRSEIKVRRVRSGAEEGI